jgi:hypothetical protein
VPEKCVDKISDRLHSVRSNHTIKTCHLTAMEAGVADHVWDLAELLA